MKIFSGQYLDGQSTKPHAAHIQLAKGGVTIQLEGEAEARYWAVEGIARNEFNIAEYVLLRYGSMPAEGLEVRDAEFLPALRAAYPEAAFLRSTYRHVLGPKGLRVIAALTLVVIGLVGFTYFVLVPNLADQTARRLPTRYEVQMGASLSQQMLGAQPMDTLGSQALQGFFRQLQVPTTQLPVRVLLIKGGIVNAYALPGGTIVVYDSMLARIHDPAELAGLLGHEYTHVQERHTLRLIFRNLSQYLLISLVTGDVGGMSSVVLQHAGTLGKLSYQRQMEREADAGAFTILKRNHLDAMGMVRMFEALKDSHSYAPPAFLSSHPALDARIETAQLAAQDEAYSVRPLSDSLQFYWQALKQQGVKKPL